MTAHKEGKKIQLRLVNFPDWVDLVSNPRWNFEELDFRVAPEPRKPREWICVLLPDGTVRPFNEPIEIPTFREGKSILVREVLE